MMVQASNIKESKDKVNWPLEIILDSEREIPLWRANLSSEPFDYSKEGIYSADKAIDGKSDTYAST